MQSVNERIHKLNNGDAFGDKGAVWALASFTYFRWKAAWYTKHQATGTKARVTGRPKKNRPQKAKSCVLLDWMASCATRARVSRSVLVSLGA